MFDQNIQIYEESKINIIETIEKDHKKASETISNENNVQRTSGKKYHTLK